MKILIWSPHPDDAYLSLSHLFEEKSNEITIRDVLNNGDSSLGLMEHYESVKMVIPMGLGDPDPRGTLLPHRSAERNAIISSPSPYTEHEALHDKILDKSEIKKFSDLFSEFAAEDLGRYDRIYVPLGVTNVDHVKIRRALLNVIDFRKLWRYFDLPYCKKSFALKIARDYVNIYGNKLESAKPAEDKLKITYDVYPGQRGYFRWEQDLVDYPETTFKQIRSAE